MRILFRILNTGESFCAQQPCPLRSRAWHKDFAWLLWLSTTAISSPPSLCERPPGSQHLKTGGPIDEQ